MLLLHAVSRSCSNQQWPSWQCVRLLASSSFGGHQQQHHQQPPHAVVVVPAEAAKAVSQHGYGLVALPGDMLQTLQGYFQDAGLSGKVYKQQALALQEKLKALSRSTAVGGLQPYRDLAGGTNNNQLTAAAAARGGGGRGGLQQRGGMDAAMTAEQQQEQREMDAEMEKLAAAVGPEMLAKYRATRQGAAAAARLQLPRTKGGRLKASARAALEEHIEQHGVLGLPHEAVRAAFGLPPSSSLMSEARGQAVKAATPKYNATQALAYALARLPGCYAASERIFRELAVRFPALQPRSLLDFGAGPGTATWAAQEVWGSSLSRLTAVEPSGPMAQLGRRLEAARRFVHPNAPLVRWRSELPPTALSARKQQAQRHGGSDIVVASYVLGELPTQQERAALVRKLWGLTSDMLVLIEPGTPAGFANILEARAGILDYEGRRVDKLQRRLAEANNQASHGAGHDSGSSSESSSSGSGSSGSGSSGSGSSGSSSSSSTRGDAMLSAKANSRWFGAHVVAPCPHDAACPLAAPGSKSWCHFGTRFERPGFMQQAKAPSGSRMNPANHQDERYSYVVLRRGTRPANTPQVDISRSFARKQAANNTQPAATGFGSATTSSSSPPPRTDVAADTSASQQQPPNVQPLTPGSRQQVFNSNELQHLSALLPPASPDQLQNEQGVMQEQQQEGATGEVSAAAVPHDAAAGEVPQTASKLGPFGEGFINRLIAQEDAGFDWTLTGAAAASDISSVSGRSSAPTEQQHTNMSSPDIQQLHSHAPLSEDDDDNDDATTQQLDPHSYPHADMSLDTDSLSDLSSDALLQAASSSSTWSRIIRPPRKRGGHILLDVCAGASSMPAQSGGVQAAIVRHVVARSDADKWMGSAGYELARSAQWGDLWPAAYDKNNKKQVVR